MTTPETITIDDTKYVRADKAQPAGLSCAKGHPYPENLFLNVVGKKVCVACRRASEKRRYARNRKRP